MALKPCENCGEEVKQRYASINKSDYWLCENCRKVERKQESVIAPQEQAREAFESGAKLFQIELPVSQTTGSVVAMNGTYTQDVDIDNTNKLEAIESEGWKLENTGYVYRVLKSVSRDKFLSSGQQEAISGEIVGIYIFRRVE